MENDTKKAQIFIDDILESLKDIDRDNYIEFYIAKIYILIKIDKEMAKQEISKIEELDLAKQQKSLIEKFKKGL